MTGEDYSQIAIVEMFLKYAAGDTCSQRKYSRENAIKVTTLTPCSHHFRDPL